jgi:hypothetical protein
MKKSLYLVAMLLCIAIIPQFSNAQITIVFSPETYNGGYNISCNGLNNGAISTAIVGGDAPYTYLWNTSAVTADITNLSSGWYVLTVTDSNNVSVTDSVELLQPDQLGLTLEGGNVSAYGGNDGHAESDVSGGTPPYSYE